MPSGVRIPPCPPLPILHSTHPVRKIAIKTFLISFFLLSTLLGCSGKAEETTTPVAEIEKEKISHPAVGVANEVLVAVANGDAEGLQKHLNATNQKKLTLEKIKKYMPEMKKDTGGITEIGELRKAPKFVGEGAVVGKCRVEGHEVFTVVLTFEEGAYRFEDFSSPSVKRYETLEKLWP
ncbi:uncharacterized protein METZ01_LOCUS396691 [marine metagenome]|uniref:DUF3887 domain-containing protein n=1 Tax=marine metagenome TaxID=408172 RepID=A0A382VBL6_9ZZZZ